MKVRYCSWWLLSFVFVHFILHWRRLNSIFTIMSHLTCGLLLSPWTILAGTLSKGRLSSGPLNTNNSKTTIMYMMANKNHLIWASKRSFIEYMDNFCIENIDFPIILCSQLPDALWFILNQRQSREVFILDLSQFGFKLLLNNCFIMVTLHTRSNWYFYLALFSLFFLNVLIKLFPLYSKRMSVLESKVEFTFLNST